MNKKILIISVIFLLVITGYFLFVFFTSEEQGTETKPGILSQFFPFGFQTPVETVPPVIEQPTTDVTPISMPILRLITAEPVAGAGYYTEFLKDKNGKVSTSTATTTFRYIQRADGHIFEGNKESGILTKISNVTIPKIYEGVWFNYGNSFLARTLDSEGLISTYMGTLLQKKSTTTEQTSFADIRTITGEFLPKNITSIAVSPSENIVYFVRGSITGTGYTYNPTSKKTFKIFDSPQSEWVVQWPTENNISFTSNASSFDTGVASLINIKTGAISKILSDRYGLTTNINSTGEKVVYGSGPQKSVEVGIYNIKTNTFSPFAVRTLPEKCVWSTKKSHIIYCAVPEFFPQQNMGYPDSWYMGLISFSDSIYKIDTELGTSIQIADLPKASGTTIDAVDLKLSPKEDYLIFTNKKNLSLWGLDISRVEEVRQ